MNWLQLSSALELEKSPFFTANCAVENIYNAWFAMPRKSFIA
jgi:hypothetical protein